MTHFTDHPYTPTDGEYIEMRQLLAESNADGAPRNCTFSRLENWRYASWDTTADEFHRMAHLWRDGDGRLAAFAIVEHADDPVTLQVRPEARAVEPAMLDWAERRFRDERAALEVMCLAGDEPREALLRERGYEDRGPAENLRAYDPARPRPLVPLPPGYRLADLTALPDPAPYIALERTAFNNDYIDERWFRAKTSAPTYDPTLHVIALAPDGSVAAVAHGWADAATGTAEIDPVATHPDHRRLHLAQAVIMEAFARLAARGVRVAWIGSGPEPNPSNRLYDSLAPERKWTVHLWSKPLE